MEAAPGFIVYTGLWMAGGVLAIALCARRASEFTILSRRYWRTLLVPWKVASFGIALVAMVWLGPRSGDPTWDAIDLCWWRL